MSSKQTAPYGSWTSPISAEKIATGSKRVGDIQVSGDSIYWLESRPAEGGRIVAMRRGPGDEIHEVTPQGFNIRSRVHEYGGGAYLAGEPGLYFVNFKDQGIYLQKPGGAPAPVAVSNGYRYADFTHDARRQRLLAVREDHTGDGEPENTIVAVPDAPGGAGGPGDVLIAGNDFYAAPRLSPDGSRLAFLTWSHPHMPWEAAELWLAELDEGGGVVSMRRVAGATDGSAAQPLWSPGGELVFAWERTGWWNLHRLRNDSVEALTEEEAEFAGPQWVFGQAWFDFLSATSLVAAYKQGGRFHLARVDTESKSLAPVTTPFNELSSVRALDGSRIAFRAGAPDRFGGIVELDLAAGEHRVVRPVSALEIDPEFISTAEALEFPTAGGRTTHALFYPPRNRDYEAPSGELPPLLVMSHGGPTSATSPALDLEIQYYTSRGIAVVDVNYGGSTGYGREYRRRLHGNWGVVDVEDCSRAASHLAETGRADPKRLAITGGSAGGYTTLACLTFRDVFAAGASHYGVSDCEALAQDTHKFESRYLDSLIGPYPQDTPVYRERSPIRHVDGLSCPVIFFQGLEDEVVPPNQTEEMVNALRRKGIPVAYLAFPGEQHGFRRAENIQRALEAELYFLGRIFGFEPADAVDPVEIENL
ncbi:MAG: prolyl oligopeptidase family serine peptidase [Candidatus Eisenbacteria bacterium]|nr:prolyl oligopeptidase family serine peptidase [Candidatus Eisenbacteria bacterium]